MRKHAWIVALVVVGAAGWVGRGAFSDDKKPAEGAEPDMEKVMEELAKPGEMHKWLAKFDGSWDVSSVFHEQDGSTITEKGTATFRMILGGRFSEQVFSGSFKGKPFEGRGLTGYDNLKKQYVNYWFDTMSTYVAPATGPAPEGGKSLTLNGSWEMPGMQMPFKYVLSWVDDKTFTFVMVGSIQGQDVPMGEMTYTRK